MWSWLPQRRSPRPSAAVAGSARPGARSSGLFRNNTSAKIPSAKVNPAFFLDAAYVHDLDSYRLTPLGDIVIRFANGVRRTVTARRAQSRAVWGKACRA